VQGVVLSLREGCGEKKPSFTKRGGKSVLKNDIVVWKGEKKKFYWGKHARIQKKGRRVWEMNGGGGGGNRAQSIMEEKKQVAG